VHTLEDQGQLTHVPMARQPIYDTERRLVAYELRFADHGSATYGDWRVDRLGGGVPLFVNVPRAFLVGDLQLPMAPGGVVLEVLGDVRVDDELLAALHGLRAQGYRLAVCEFMGEAPRLPLLPLADYVKLDAETVGSALPRLVALAREHAPQIQVVVDRVDDPDALRACAAAGADLVQGAALQPAVTLTADALSPTQVVCLRLLAALGSEEASAVDVEPIVAADAALTVRVLRAANSAASVPGTSVRSLRQALVLLGPRQLSSWVLLMLLGAETAARPEDLTTVLARAEACATVCTALAADRSDVAYTVGLLAGVSDVLGIGLADLVASTGVDAEASSALLDRVGPCGRALSAVLAHETGDDASAQAAGISTFEVSRAYLEALSSALRIVTSLTG
jgi:EAL and modified HD-GYP domain-containing signal transduction protein